MLTSVLKPVDDTRMLEKIGMTLTSAGYEVFIIAYPSARLVNTSGITILPHREFNRTSARRLLMPWTIFKKINQVKPELIITNTPELLLVMMIQKVFFRRKIIYDILENYYRNIIHTKTYPAVIRWLLAAATRLTEVVVAPFIDLFLLAERGYAKELKFARSPVILENKLPKKVADRYLTQHAAYYDLLFTGTLAPTTGIFEAINLSKQLHQLNPAYTLTIIGYAALPEVLKNIKQEIQNSPFISLLGGDRLVAHEEILNAISKAGTGIIIYPSNPGTESSVPTKVYEYLALKLPILISHTEDSTRLVTESNSGIILDHDFNPAVLNQRLANSNFTFEYDNQIFWEADQENLIKALDKLQ